MSGLQVHITCRCNTAGTHRRFDCTLKPAAVIAEALGYEIKSDYADRRHLCQEGREVLQNKDPRYLQPMQHQKLN